MGVIPDDLSLHNLMLMHEGKSREEWQHTSNMMWLIYSVNSGKKNDKKKPSDFNPWECKKQGGTGEQGWDALRDMFKHKNKEIKGDEIG